MKNKLHRTIVVLLFLSCKLMAQTGVGIGINDPDDSAILHLHSTTQGLLVPRMDIDQMNAIPSKAVGLLVFRVPENRFYFWNGAGWYALNTMERPVTTSDVTHTGNLTVSATVTTNTLSATTISATNYGTVSATAVNVNGTVNATNYALNASGNGPIPQGGIIMWSGQTPPTGWALCDGGNNTPDLRGRFIVGYNPGATDYDQPGNRSFGGGTSGETGGVAAVALTTAQMPPHTHSYRAPLVNGDHPGGNSGFDRPNGLNDGTTGSTGGVTYPAVYTTDTSGYPCTGWDPWNDEPTPYGCNTNYGNQILVSPAYTEAQPHENRPPYYVLAFIMKL